MKFLLGLFFTVPQNPHPSSLSMDTPLVPSPRHESPLVTPRSPSDPPFVTLPPDMDSILTLYCIKCREWSACPGIFQYLGLVGLGSWNLYHAASLNWNQFFNYQILCTKLLFVFYTCIIFFALNYSLYSILVVIFFAQNYSLYSILVLYSLHTTILCILYLYYILCTKLLCVFYTRYYIL